MKAKLLSLRKSGYSAPSPFLLRRNPFCLHTISTMNKYLTLITAITSVSLTLFAQNGDLKEKNPDLLSSENWKQWSPDPVPVLSPEESLKTFKVADGFKIELVAAEPLIKDPVFAEWDAEGRLWVCEFNTYMIDLDGSDENQRISRVVVLEDTDGDGRMDKSTPFVEDMINPRTLSLVEGGVLIGESGKLWFCEDTDGDLVCDKKTELMDFAVEALDNIEHAENSLHFSIDNWMYNSKTKRRIKWSNGSIVTSPAQARGQWGMASDAYGRLYHNHNSTWFSVDWDIYDKQWPLNGKEMPAPTKEVFPIHPTTALNRAYQAGMLTERGVPKSVTSISGLAVHSHGAFGDDWEGAIFGMSPGTNTVGAFKPNKPFPETTGYEHISYPDKEWDKREFLASTDARFRPVNASFGPDGALYIVDFHRGVIQHKKFLTSYLRNQSEERELDQPIGLGRIYRVVPDDHKPVAAPENLVAGLSHPYLWWRLNSQKKIVEGNRDDLKKEIVSLAMNGDASPFARTHAMWSLEGMGSLDDSVVKKNTADSDWFVAMTALRLAGAAAGATDLFPEGSNPAATEIAKRDLPLLSRYAGTLSTSGYPSRSVINFKDNEAAWVKKDKDLQKQYREGLKHYATICAACHQPHGKGLENLAPSLVKSDWVNGDSKRLIAVGVHGLMGDIKVNGKAITGVPPVMPGLGFLPDDQLANMMTYVRNAWGNKGDAVSADDIAEYRKAHGDRLAPWTEAELEAAK